MKKFFVALAVLILVLLLVVILLPFIIDLNAYQARYLPLIEESLNRKVTIKDLRLTLLPRIGVHISELTVMDDPLFSTGPFASLESLDLGMKLRPLLSGRVEIDQIIMRRPAITVIKNSLGMLNVSTLGQKGSKREDEDKDDEDDEDEDKGEKEPAQILSLLAVGRLSLSDGQVTYRDRSSAKPTEYMLDQFQVLLQGVGLGLTPTVHVSGTVQPLNLPIKIDGTLGPLRENLDMGVFVFDVALGKALFEVKGSTTGGDVRFAVSSAGFSTQDLPIALPLTRPVDVKNLRLVAERKDSSLNIGALDLLIALGKDTVTVNGSVIDGHARLKMTAPAITTTNLPLALPLTKPVEATNLVAIAEMKQPHVRLQNLSVNLFGGHLKAQVEMTTGSAPLPFSAKITAEGLQLGPLAQAVGTESVTLSGTGSAELEMRGKGLTMPDLTKELEGSGHLLLKDGNIEGIALLKEAATLLKAIGVTKDLGNATVFSAIESNIKIHDGIILIERLIAKSPDFDATGKGAIGLDKTLNLNLSLILSEALSKEIAQSSPVGKAMMTRGRLAVPMVITGTTQAPKYALDTTALGRNVQGQVKEKLGELLKDQKGQDILRQGEETLKKLFGQ